MDFVERLLNSRHVMGHVVPYWVILWPNGVKVDLDVECWNGDVTYLADIWRVLCLCLVIWEVYPSPLVYVSGWAYGGRRYCQWWWLILDLYYLGHGI